ncbi:MAG: hypothetical protein ACI37T_02135 [Candidatus Gastranaerophilaceae bacterium]
MANIKELFGLKIKEYRKKYLFTQVKLAELVNVELKGFFEFYYLQDEKELKEDIINMINTLNIQ